MSIRNELLEQILAASNGFVKSVTGSDVDNTDPKNPIIIEKQFFLSTTISTVTIGTDPNSPSFLTGMSIDSSSSGISAIDANGAVRNLSGREIPSMDGTISFQPNKAGGGTTTVHLWSERSADGVAWTQNAQSLRVLEIPNNGETFKTSISSVTAWANGDYLRFRLYSPSGGTIDFSSPTDTVLGGENIVGASVIWALSEH